MKIYDLAIKIQTWDKGMNFCEYVSLCVYEREKEKDLLVNILKD